MAASRHDIASRVRLLLEQEGDGDPVRAARRIGVDETALRLCIDELAPRPTIDVLAALVACYGVDPTFLMTGEYDRDTHWYALEGGRRAARKVLARLMEFDLQWAPSQSTHGVDPRAS